MSRSSHHSYIASTESTLFDYPRAVFLIDRSVTKEGQDALIVEFDPPVNYQGQPLTSAILTAHFVQRRVHPIDRWPVPVYVFKSSNPDTCRYSSIDLQSEATLIAWAELYPSLADAKQAVGAS
jgi:hypothetical protein